MEPSEFKIGLVSGSVSLYLIERLWVSEVSKREALPHSLNLGTFAKVAPPLL